MLSSIKTTEQNHIYIKNTVRNPLSESIKHKQSRDHKRMQCLKYIHY